VVHRIGPRAAIRHPDWGGIGKSNIDFRVQGTEFGADNLVGGMIYLDPIRSMSFVMMMTDDTLLCRSGGVRDHVEVCCILVTLVAFGCTMLICSIDSTEPEDCGGQ
jgi:hypothetical protein